MEGFWAFVWKTSFNRSWLVLAGGIGYGLVGLTLIGLFTQWIAIAWLGFPLGCVLGWNWGNFKTLVYGDLEESDEENTGR